MIKYLLAILLLGSMKQDPCMQMDIILLLDYSGSIDGNEGFVREAVQDFVKGYELSEQGIKIGVITFSDYTNTISPLISDRSELLKRICVLDNFGGSGSTHMIRGLEVAEKEFYTSGRLGFKRVIIIISDGDVNSGGGKEETLKVAEGLKKFGFKICSVLIQNKDSEPEFMQALSNECYVETKYSDLRKELLKLQPCL